MSRNSSLIGNPFFNVTISPALRQRDMNMKQIYTIALLLLTVPLFGQEPQTGRFDFYKKIADVAPGITITYEGSPDNFRDVLAERLSQSTNDKLDKIKGDLSAHLALVYPAISEQTLDYYFLIEEDNRQGQKTKVTMFLSLGNDNFLTQQSHPAEYAAAINMLSTLSQDINAELMRVALAEMEAALEAEEKRMKELLSEAEELAKVKKKLEADLEENKKAIEANIEAKEKQKEILQLVQSQVQTLRVQTGGN